MIHHGDCLDVMAAMEPESVSAIVTDPPYGIGFMGKEWDGFSPAALAKKTANHLPIDHRLQSGRAGSMHAGVYDQSLSGNQRFQAWCTTWAAAALRVAKPGAHLLAFGGTRTHHRLMAAIEDAGWEIRDCLVWVYASGFPKSLDVSKAIDAAAGNERPETGEQYLGATNIGKPGERYIVDGPTTGRTTVRVTSAGSPSAARWQGWGTALKPAWEPIVMARKPLRGTVAANVLRDGTGALNIDGTRLPVAADDPMNEAVWTSRPSAFREGTVGFITSNDDGDRRPTVQPLGRWPADVILTDPIFDGGVQGVVGGGETTPLPDRPWTKPSPDGALFAGVGGAGTMHHDSGTYSRFFLIPKADRGDREPVLGGLDPRQEKGHRRTGVVDNPRLRGETWRQNHHPTVKPVELMRHLVRLVTPAGGIVLDPFLGSGTTALAAEMEGFAWVGIEIEAEYIAIAEARLNGTQRGLGLVDATA